MSKPVINPVVCNRAAHMMLVCKLASSGNAGALALLSNPGSLAQDYIEFATKQAVNHKLQLCDILGALSDDDVDSLRKALPKDSAERAKFTAAIVEAKASLPCAWKLDAAGTITIGKELSKCAMITANPMLAGDSKPTKFMLGLKKWRWIASLSDADLATLRGLLAQADVAGMM